MKIQWGNLLSHVGFGTGAFFSTLYVVPALFPFMWVTPPSAVRAVALIALLVELGQFYFKQEELKAIDRTGDFIEWTGVPTIISGGLVYGISGAVWYALFIIGTWAFFRLLFPVLTKSQP